MSYRDFMHSTMSDIQKRIEVYRDEKKNEAKETEFKAWLYGLYVRNAITSSFVKNSKYPDNPLNTEEPIDIEKMTEDELIDAQEQALKKLDLMARLALGVKDEPQGE